jgi:uncharacterized FlgJ-related protein
MYIYTYCKKTLTYSKINLSSYLIRSAVILVTALSLVSINTMDANEYERILEVRTRGNEFSKERFRAKLNELNVRFADVAVAQAILETNTFRSGIFMENNNLFGMKEAKTRINLARGSQYGHAYYDSWEDSVLDYAMWCATYAKHCRTNEQFLSLLNGYYAEDPNYIAKLRRIMSRQ